MKLGKLLVLSTACLAVPFSMTGCGKKVGAGGENTVQVRVYAAGYGTDWLTELIKQFELTFPGKKVEIVEASPNVPTKAEQEIQSPKNNQIDLYFTCGAKLTTLIDASQGVLRTDKKTLLEPLGSILDSKAIGADGNEETQTIRERLYNGYEEAGQYHGKNTKWQDTLYKLPWADAAQGVFANPTVLEACGVDYKEILTSDDFQAAIEKIASFTATKNIYPYAWAGANAPGYWLYLWQTYYTQYAGIEASRNFMKCDPTGNDDLTQIKQRGYEVYQDEGILKSLEAMYGILDRSYSPARSDSATHMTAQGYLMDNLCGFMIDGDWLLNEMKKDYFEKASNIVMLQTPIISSLGTKIGLSSDADLHKLIKAVDEIANDDVVVATLASEGVTVTLDQVDAIRDARNVHDVGGVNHDIVIPEYADAKETAKLFVRFMYSNDGCRIVRNNAYYNLPVKYQTQEGDTNTNFQKSVDKNNNNGNVTIISDKMFLNDVREKSGMQLFNASVWSSPNTFKAIIDDKAKTNPILTPQYIFQSEANYMQTNWSKYIK